MKNRSKKNGSFPQPERGRSSLSYLRARRRARLLLRELRRLDAGTRRWEPMTPNVGTQGAAGGGKKGTLFVLETGTRKVKVDPTSGRVRASGRGYVLVCMSQPFITAPVKWTSLRKTAEACRKTATVLEVMSS